MNIPRQLPQFDEAPVLIVVSGEFEAHFFAAHAGEIRELDTIRHIPREETIGKDWGYTKSSSAMPSSGAVSAQGKRLLNLRKKFQEEAASLLQEKIRSENAREIYFFAPAYVSPGILERLEQHAKQKIRKVFDGEYTKETPVTILGIIAESQRTARDT